MVYHPARRRGKSRCPCNTSLIVVDATALHSCNQNIDVPLRATVCQRTRLQTPQAGSLRAAMCEQRSCYHRDTRILPSHILPSCILPQEYSTIATCNQSHAIQSISPPIDGLYKCSILAMLGAQDCRTQNIMIVISCSVRVLTQNNHYYLYCY